jgi:hypothetical protein
MVEAVRLGDDWCFWRQEDGSVVLRSLNFIPLSLVNGLRRVLLTDLPALVFAVSDVVIEVNTTQFNSDDLKMRLAAVPLRCERPDQWAPAEGVEPMVHLEAELAVGEAGPRMVTSASLVEGASAVGLEITNSDIDLVELIRGVGETRQPRIKAHMRASVRTPRQHSLAKVITIDLFRHVPRWELDMTGGNPRVLVSAERRRARESELSASLPARQRFIETQRDIEKHSVMGYPRYVEMVVGSSVGSMDSLQAIWHAFRLLAGMLTDFANDVRSRRSNIVWIDEGVSNKLHLIVQECDDTVANCVKQAFLDELYRLIDSRLPEARRNQAWLESIGHYNNLYHNMWECVIILKASDLLGESTEEIMLRGLERYVNHLGQVLREVEGALRG